MLGYAPGDISNCIRGPPCKYFTPLGHQGEDRLQWIAARWARGADFFSTPIQWAWAEHKLVQFHWGNGSYKLIATLLKTGLIGVISPIYHCKWGYLTLLPKKLIFWPTLWNPIEKRRNVVAKLGKRRGKTSVYLTYEELRWEWMQSQPLPCVTEEKKQRLATRTRTRLWVDFFSW